MNRPIGICITGLLLLAALLSGPVAAAAAQPAKARPLDLPALEKTLDLAARNLGEIQSLKTRFIQEKEIALFSETVVSQGICLFKKPGHLRLEFTTPFASILLARENHFYKFNRFNGEWKTMNPGDEEIMSMVLGHIGGWLSGNFNEKGLYRVEGYKAPQGVTLILTPKSPEFREYISAFELDLNAGLTALTRIQIHGNEGDVTRISFRDDRVNIPVPESLFDGSNGPPPPVPAWWGQP